MNATILVVCYKSKTLSNEEHPLMLRIAQDGKSRYKSLKISVDAKYWDFEKSQNIQQFVVIVRLLSKQIKFIELTNFTFVIGVKCFLITFALYALYINI